VGVEDRLRTALDRPDIEAAVIHGSWATGQRRPDSDIDVLVVGDADLRELRRVVRPIGKAAGRTIDIVLMSVDEFRNASRRRSSFARRLLEGPLTPLVGSLSRVTER
jgi:predicted nucleotidyltransferase